MKWYEYVILMFVTIAMCILVIILPVETIRGVIGNDSRHIRTFSGTHTLVWKDTLWRLEPVELGKAGVKIVDTIIGERSITNGIKR